MREDLYHETLSLYRRALHIREAVWERTRPDDSDRSENAYELAESYDNMGTLLMDLGRHGEAGSYLTRAAEILSEEAELVHERNAKTLILIGRALRAEKDYPTAAATLRSALAIYENISVRPPRFAASALSNLGAVLAEWAEQDGALSALRRAQLLEASSTWLRAALNGFEQMHGEWYPATGGILRALAGVCDAQGNTEDGHHYGGREEANRRANLEAENADAASVLNRHGTSLKVMASTMRPTPT